jgi:hypothetical protein
MRRLLLVSTAVLGLAASTALAQQAEPVQPTPLPQQPAAVPAQPATPDTGPTTTGAPAQPAETTAAPAAPKPVPEQAEHQVRAQSLLGVDVSNGEATIGEVSDLVVTEDGRVEAVVVGVGGFLGIGQKRVALAWDSIKLTEQDGRRVILVSATREQLEGMPTFKTLEERRAEEDAAAAQRQMQQQPGVAPGVTPGLTPPPPPQPGNQ